MAAKVFVPPNLANVTPEAMVDELGKIKQIAKWAKAMEGFYKEALYGRVERKAQSLPAGEKYAGSVSSEERTRIVPDLVRGILTAEQLKEVSETKDQLVMRITPTAVDIVQLDKDLRFLMIELGLDEDEEFPT